MAELTARPTPGAHLRQSVPRDLPRRVCCAAARSDAAGQNGARAAVAGWVAQPQICPSSVARCRQRPVVSAPCRRRLNPAARCRHRQAPSALWRRPASPGRVLHRLFPHRHRARRQPIGSSPPAPRAWGVVFDHDWLRSAGSVAIGSNRFSFGARATDREPVRHQQSRSEPVSGGQALHFLFGQLREFVHQCRHVAASQILGNLAPHQRGLH